MRFEEMKQALIQAARAAGLAEYEIFYQSDESISAETLKDEISSFSSGVSGGVCFRCIVNGKMGMASSELMTRDAMEELVQKAISNAACIDSDDEVFIFEGSPSYATFPERKVELCDAKEIRDLALGLQRALYAESDKVGDGTQSAALSAVIETVLCNSKGLELSSRGGMSCGYAMPVCRDGEEAHESYEVRAGADLAQMQDLPKRAVQSALDKFGATSVASGKYDVLFDGKQFRAFLSAFSSAFSAKNAQKGLSKLAGKEGERIASACVNIIDDPMREGALMQTNFDGEGVATARRSVVENGVLKTLLYDLTTAKKAGVASTGNAHRGYDSPVVISPYNFGIMAGEESEQALFAAVGNGIYINECKGFHAGANAVTGDFSIESAGFMIRDGKRAEPVRSFTVAGNFFELLKQIERLGSEVKWGVSGSLTVYGSPDVLVRGMSVAGK